MKKIDTKFIKIGIIIALIVIFFGEAYIFTEDRSFGGPTFTHLVNKEFTYLESFFQQEPEEVFTPVATNIPKVKIPIMIYHSIRPYIKGESLMQDRFDITPEFFEQQLKYLQDHKYTTITPDELEKDIKQGSIAPNTKPILLTFDDGWENQYKYAYPLLKKYNMIATFYVYTEPIDRKRPSYLSWEQIKEMDKAGMTIGSHTLTHPLFKHATYDGMKKEIFESKKILEQELGKPVVHFAQPFGYTNPTIESLIKEAGYETSRGTYRGVNHSMADLYYLQGYFTSDNFKDFTYILSR